jgi:diguanylate cyclase (GGDEF)-like protein
VIRAGDVVARIGGDEFVVACNTDRPTVATVADRIRDAVASTPFELGEQGIWMSASVGHSHMSRRPEDTGALLDEADRAMYLVKAPRA